MKSLIQMSNLTKRYFSKAAVINASLNFEEGYIYGLLGPNGSGKTTLMKVIAGLHKHNEGTLKVLGEDISYKTKAQVVFMPTEDYLYSNMKLKDIIKFYKEQFRDFNSNKIYSLLPQLDLNADLKVSELSTGLRGRFKVALAVSRNAQIYMFDEPLNGLDPISRESVLKLITGIIEPNKLIIVSSHIVSELETILDKVIFLNRGHIEINEDAEEIRTKRQKSIEDVYKEVYR